MQDNSESEKWNNVYIKEPEQLAWFGLDFPSQVEEYLSKLSKNDPILVTGCGVGDTAYKVQTMGFTHVIGTDISSTAIAKATSRFPTIHFEAVATEEIPTQNKYTDVNVLDWLNAHQIHKLKEYLHVLAKISKNLCIVWINDSNKETTAQSYVHKDQIYFHNAVEVKEILEQAGLTMTQEFNFTFTTNPQAGLVRTHAAVGQTYVKH